jgi:RHS repeat-associated protein
MITMPKPGSPASAMICVYDPWNRLVKVTDSAGTTTIAEYRYDGLGRRIAKLVPSGENWDRTDYHYNEAWQCLEQRYGEGQAKETVPDTPNVQYLWDIRYIDAPVLRWRSVSGTLNEVLYFCNDANMNVTALVSASGTVEERYVYEVYGKASIYDGDWQPVAWEGSKHNDVLYCGYRWDFETGLYQVRYRYYHPTLGRSTCRDPIGYADGLNVYEYVRAKPPQEEDPLGLWLGPERNSSKPRARVCSDKSYDTWLSLADMTLLDEDEYHLWAKHEESGTFVQPGEQPQVGEWYTVPNKVIADYGMHGYSWYRNFVSYYTFQVMERFARAMTRGWQSQGLMIETHAASVPGTKDIIAQHLRDEDLWGYVYVGHGSGGILTYAYTSGQKYSIVPGKYVHHRIAKMLLLACGSLAPSALGVQNFDPRTVRGRTGPQFSLWELNVSRRGLLFGYLSDNAALWNQSIWWNVDMRPGGLRMVTGALPLGPVQPPVSEPM